MGPGRCGGSRRCAVRAADRGFCLDLEEGPLRRERIAADLAWHVARMEGGPDLRESPRLIPDRPGVVVHWADAEQEGTLLDVSNGGAAADMAIRPAMDSPVTVGMRRGIVVRHTQEGVWIRFVLPLRVEDKTRAIVL